MRDAIASGNVAKMRRLEATAVEWVGETTQQLDDVKKTLKQLRDAIKSLK